MRRKGRDYVSYVMHEPFVQGLICKKPKLFMLLPSALDGIELEETESCEEVEKGGLPVECEDQEAQITLHALS